MCAGCGVHVRTRKDRKFDPPGNPSHHYPWCHCRPSCYAPSRSGDCILMEVSTFRQASCTSQSNYLRRSLPKQFASASPSCVEHVPSLFYIADPEHCIGVLNPGNLSGLSTPRRVHQAIRCHIAQGKTCSRITKKFQRLTAPIFRDSTTNSIAHRVHQATSCHITQCPGRLTAVLTNLSATKYISLQRL